MAKTTVCAICGKEINKGFLGSNVEHLDIGSAAFGLTCCKECHATYKSVAIRHKERFNAKLENFKRANKKKKLSEQEVGALFVEYAAASKPEKPLDKSQILPNFSHFYRYSEEGRFAVREFALGFFNSDVCAKAMVKSKAESALLDFNVFDRNDITKIEYSRAGSGDPLGLFSIAYSFNIRLNDERVMTYKPCITRAAFVGHGFGFGYYRSAEKKLIAELEALKRIIGSDLPITKVFKM